VADAPSLHGLAEIVNGSSRVHDSRKRGITPRIARRGIESSEKLGRYRWAVERTLSWLNRFRQLKVRHEHEMTSIKRSWISDAPSSAGAMFSG
jgi:transposase